MAHSDDVSNVNTMGSDLTVTGGEVTVTAGSSISTRRIEGEDFANAPSIGDSGSVSLSGSRVGAKQAVRVTLGQGAAIYAQVEEDSEFEAGDVTIEADNVVETCH